jgi:hypothetical protein
MATADHDVLGLDVPVHQPGAVNRLERDAKLSGDEEGVGYREKASP